ncbi:MAG: pyridoxal phosphate-dependent aminotransferase [Desulfurococcales archaeon]|nr:pyridoxal phosphate-dependent aminotransferase [Desulfurococcales archaeon]
MSQPPTLGIQPLLSEIEGETGFIYLGIARRLKAEGRDIVSFGIGQPDFPTPAHIREAAKRALDEGFTGYTETAGIPELREAISWYLNSRYNAGVEPDEVVVATGAKTAVFMALAAYTAPGDEVIIPEPSYYAYAQVVKLFRGIPRFVPMKFTPGYGFSLDVEAISKAVTDRTKAIVINNPHNPTGSVFTRDQVEELYELARKKGLIIIADEIYDNFVFEGSSFKSVLSFDDWRDHVVYINGFSKTFSMTGWRLGYVVVRREVIQRFTDLAVTLYSCAPSFAQKAAVEAIKGDWGPVEEMVREFSERAKLLRDLLEDAKGFEVYKPQGAFYMFPRVEKLASRAKLSTEDIVRKLLFDYGVLVLPGRSFPDKAGEWHVRLSFATSREEIKEGARRIIEFTNEVYG